MKNLYRLLFIVSLFASGLFFTPEVKAQCPMCKISAESNLANGGSAGRGLNAGIFYMLALPYSLVGTIGFLWWKNNRRKEEDEVEVLP
jgi:hypothetical protein